jgi:hypothetical protein
LLMFSAMFQAFLLRIREQHGGHTGTERLTDLGKLNLLMVV